VRPSPLSLLALAFLVSVQAKAADPTTRDLIALAPQQLKVTATKSGEYR